MPGLPTLPLGSGHVLIDSPLMDRRIRSAIETTLKSKGYPPAESARPDFFVTYQLVVKSRIEVNTVGPAFGWVEEATPYPYWGGIDYTTYVDQYEVGTLIIDFTDAQTHQLFRRGIGVGAPVGGSYEEGVPVIDLYDTKTSLLFWRGSGAGRFNWQAGPEKTTEEINTLVDKVMAQFPPPES